MLNLLQLVWEKTQKEYGIQYVYESKDMIKLYVIVPHVSATFRSLTLKNKNKFKVFAAPRLNQIAIPFEIVLSKFLLINLQYQRLMLF